MFEISIPIISQWLRIGEGEKYLPISYLFEETVTGSYW